MSHHHLGQQLVTNSRLPLIGSASSIHSGRSYPIQHEHIYVNQIGRRNNKRTEEKVFYC